MKGTERDLIGDREMKDLQTRLLTKEEVFTTEISLPRLKAIKHAILNEMNYYGCLNYKGPRYSEATDEERALINKVWRTLAGSSCFFSAVQSWIENYPEAFI